MDKETLSNYGWIVICVLVLAVMIALATPFGNFIAGGFKATFLGFGQTNNSVLDTMFDTTGTPPSPDYLQSKYQFEYYSTLNGAVNDVNNGTIGTNADVDKEDAVAGIYTDENGGVNVVLLQDTTEDTRISPAADMIINLGGNTVDISNDAISIDVMSGNVTIDGRLNGSVVKERVQVRSGNTTIIGGTYIQETEQTGKSVLIMNAGNLTIKDAKIIVTNNLGDITAIQNNKNAHLSITNCDVSTYGATDIQAVLNNGTVLASNCNIIVQSSGNAGTVLGITTSGTAVIENCNIVAYTNYENGVVYSHGVVNTSGGNATIKNCSIFGTHSGVGNFGSLFVNGGTYEGYGHGGFYFSGTGSTVYVQNATIRHSNMPDGYLSTGVDNKAGFYIGGQGNSNITVYMDNCDIYGDRWPIVLRDSSGEHDNTLCISNSRINAGASIRIDNDTLKVYLGVGNNFTGTNTNRQSSVTITTETYTKQ